MASSNEAAGALARGNQSVAVTVQQMNATAAELGASDHCGQGPQRPGQGRPAQQRRRPGADRPCRDEAPGLPRLRHDQTDLLSRRQVRRRQAQARVHDSNHNTLLFSYQGAIGVKNGYTIAAKFTYVEAATRGGENLPLVRDGQPHRNLAAGCGDVGLGLRPRAFTHPDWRACGPRRAGREEADRRRSRTSRSAARHRTRIGPPACAAGLDRRGRR